MSEAHGEAAPTAAAGWFPDPNAPGKLRYWDGSSWTEHRHDPSAPTHGLAPFPSPKVIAARKRGNARNAIGIGGVVFAISPFLTWVNVALLGGLNLFQLVNQNGTAKGIVWAAVLAGGTAAWTAWSNDSGPDPKIAGLVIGLAAAAASIYVLAHLVPAVKEADGFARLAIGPYVALGASIAMVVGALLIKPERSTVG